MEYNPRRLSEIDAVEIVDLRGIYADRADLYMREAKSAPYVRLTGESALEIARLWRELPSSEQMRCHTPPYGLRFYNNDSLLLQASICWQCNNIYGEVGSEKLFYKFDAEHPISQKLLGVCKESIE